MTTNDTTEAQAIIEPTELNEGELNQVNGGALPPIRGPKQPPETDLIGLL